MAEIADYMSWNIESLSDKKAIKEVFRNVTVASWIAVLVDEMQATVIGIMEVTLGSGEKAVELLKDEINARKKAISGNSDWTCKTSDRNVDTSHAFARRADKYAVIWNKANVTVNDIQVADSKTVTFADRKPLYWTMQDISDGKPKLANCLLWHAPQPKYHRKDVTIKAIADLAAEITTSTKNDNFLISGDFNYNTANAFTYTPLTSAGFTGIFNGEKTTLTTVKTFINDIANREKMILKGDVDTAFLANAYDNVFIRGIQSNWELKVCVPNVVLQEIRNNVQFQIVTRMQLQLAMKNAKIISDHMPLVLTVEG